MLKQTEKVKPSSKTVVTAALEKARPNLPAKPLPKKAPPPEEKTVKGTKPVANKQNAVKPKVTNRVIFFESPKHFLLFSLPVPQENLPFPAAVEKKTTMWIPRRF